MKQKSAKLTSPTGPASEILKFLNDHEAVREWQSQNNLFKMLGPRPPQRKKWINDFPGLLLTIKDFLPDKVAHAAREIVQSVPQESWTLLRGDAESTNLDGINCAHHLHATVGPTGVEGVDALYKLLSEVLPSGPGKHCCFHLGKFSKGDFMDVQDDAAYALAENAEGEVVKCSRSIAVMLFLSNDWDLEKGGCFKDCQQTEEATSDTVVPAFNTLVAFHVPRLYEITRVVAEATRFCVFGWSLQEGELYDLHNVREQPTLQKSKKKTKKKPKKEDSKGGETSSVPQHLVALAAERQEARKQHDYARADEIRDTCRAAGYNIFGSKLVPIGEGQSKKKKSIGGEEGEGKSDERVDDSTVKQGASDNAVHDSAVKKTKDVQVRVSTKQGGEGKKASGKSEVKIEDAKRKVDEDARLNADKVRGKVDKVKQGQGVGGKRKERDDAAAADAVDKSKGGAAASQQRGESVQVSAQAAGQNESKKIKKPKKPKSKGVAEDKEEQDDMNQGNKKKHKGNLDLLERIRKKGWLGKTTEDGNVAA